MEVKNLMLLDIEEKIRFYMIYTNKDADIVKVIKAQRIRWMGHIVWAQDDITTEAFLNHQPQTGWRKGRQRE